MSQHRMNFNLARKEMMMPTFPLMISLIDIRTYSSESSWLIAALTSGHVIQDMQTSVACRGDESGINKQVESMFETFSF